MASREAATNSSQSLFSICSKVGLAMNLPSTRPTRTPAMGPFHGIWLMCSAAEAPIIARVSGGLTWSNDRTVQMICTSDM